MPESTTIFRLIYNSQSTLAPEATTAEFGAIFTAARRNNRDLGITGALLTTEHAFAQTLEGEERAVRDLYEHIAADPRHENLTILEHGDVDDRVFGRWAMAKVAEDGGPDIRLMSNASRGQIVAAGPDPHVTPEQERVIGFMRESLLDMASRPVRWTRSPARAAPCLPAACASPSPDAPLKDAQPEEARVLRRSHPKPASVDPIGLYSQPRKPS